jgi:acyl-CoA dehydrogenase
MSDVLRMLRDMTQRLMGEQCTFEVRAQAEFGEWPENLWRQVEDAGLTLAAVPEDLGGAGAAITDAMVIMHAVGRHAVPLPLVESILANWLLATCGAPAADGPLTIVPIAECEPIRLSPGRKGWVLSGNAFDVPWGCFAKNIVVVAQREDGRQAVVLVPANDCEIQKRSSVAGDPRDDVRFNAVALSSQALIHVLERGESTELLEVGALARCHQMTGAMEWALERSCAYVGERVQFGKPVGGFQAVQQLIAMMATQVSAAAAATDAATAALGNRGLEQTIGYAKARVGEAAGEVAALAHQVHGAMGYSHEYPLHFRLRRMWLWREEFGSERFWQVREGRRLASHGGDSLWRTLTV